MKDLELLLPRVLEKAAACPEPTALRHLRDAAIEFCRRTRVWRDTETFTLGTDECEAVAVDQDATIYEISDARFSSDNCSEVTLKPRTIDWLDQERPGWRTQQGVPEFRTQSAPDTVRVVPQPQDTGGTLTLELILIPSALAEQLPDVLVDVYAKEIADGALGSVLLLPAEFGNAELGAMHKQLFADALGRFGDRVPRGQQRSPRRTKPASFF